MTQHLKGAAVSAEIIENIRMKGSSFPGRIRLDLLRMGEKGEDLSYEKAIIKKAEEAGIWIKTHALLPDLTPQQAERLILDLNEDPEVHGVLIFRPLLNPAVEQRVLSTLSPKKDVDGITPLSMAGIFRDDASVFPPCTAQACMKILAYYQIPLEGKNVVVLGRSQVIGKPVAMMLLKENATVTICHSKTKNLKEVVRRADILVSAMGKARAVTREYLQPGQIVLDVGINFDEQGKLCGDVDWGDAEKVVAAITPVPGGVGSVTTALLLEHTMEAAMR
jgi:methylenetetrahydrofolate dehydrogenase (NADP+)/methenyltetrahydrofolate cyclohydrolase